MSASHFLADKVYSNLNDNFFSLYKKKLEELKHLETFYFI